MDLSAAAIGFDQVNDSDDAEVNTIDLDLSSLASAIDSPAELAAALRRIPGVRGVAMLPGGVSITRSPVVPWERLLPEIKHAIRGCLRDAAE
jgi:hypothetical protein